MLELVFDGYALERSRSCDDCLLVRRDDEIGDLEGIELPILACDASGPLLVSFCGWSDVTNDTHIEDELAVHGRDNEL